MNVTGVTRASSFSHKWTRVGAAVTCLLALLILPGGAWAEQTPLSPDLLGSIAGVVTDSQETPLPNIEVSALVGYNIGSGDISYNVVRTATTDATGVYRLPVLPTGLYRLQFRDPNDQYALEFYQHASTPQAGTDVAVAGNNLTGVNTTLSAGGRITGTVTIQNEIGILGGTANIYKEGDTGWQILTSVPITQASTYDSGALLPGAYRICVNGYYPNGSLQNCYGNSQTVQNAADITIGAGEIKANQNIDLSAGQFDSAISGVVTANNGALAAGIKVGLYPAYYNDTYPALSYALFAYVLTDETGRYTLGGLTAGQYVVGFSDPAGRYATTFFREQHTPLAASPLSLQNSQVISNVNTILFHGGQINGHVQRANGAPISNVLVQLYWQAATSVPPIPPTPTPTPFLHAATATATPAPVATPTAAVPLPPDYWQPMISYYTKTDATGNYTLQGLWPGAYRLSFYLCPPSYPYNYSLACELEYYGSEYNVYQATDVKVEADKTTTGINLTLGPDHFFYLPLASQ